MGVWNTDTVALTNTTANPVTASAQDGQPTVSLGGKQGDDYVSEIHGKWYTAAYRGGVFLASTPKAGQVIPVLGATTQTALSLYNPLGSGKNLELISFRFGESITTATFVVGSIGFGVITNIGAGVALPTSQVLATVFSNPIGAAGPAPVAQALATVTITAATNFMDIGMGTGLTTGQTFSVFEKLFDGTVILAPGTLIAVQGTVAQTSSYVLGMTWAEWPV